MSHPGTSNRHEESCTETEVVFERVNRSLIVGLHPCLKHLYEQLSIPPLRQVPAHALTTEIIVDLIESFPIRVSREDRRLRCTGNVRLYQLALRYLPETAVIPCLVEPPLPEASLARRALKELLYGTACLGAHFSDVPILAEVIRRAIDAQHLPQPVQSSDTLIAHLYGVDRRRFRASDSSESKHSSGSPIDNGPRPDEDSRSDEPEGQTGSNIGP